MFDISTLSISLPFFLFVALIFVSIYLSRIREITAEGYFFADHDSSWLVHGSSFLTTWISGFFVFEMIIPRQSIWLIIAFAVVSTLMLAILGGFVGPVLMKMRISTLPEYFERRFGRGSKFYLSILYIFCNVALKLVVVLSLGGILIGKVAHIDPFSPLLFFLIITGIYVVVGGLKTEMYTSILEGILIVVVLTFFSFWLGSQKNLGGPSVADTPSVQEISLGTSLKSFGGWLLLALPVVGFWFWGADQAIFQRVLSAPSVQSLRRATVYHGVLQVIPVILMAGAGIAFVPEMLTGKTVDAVFAPNAVPEMLRVSLLLAIAAALMALFAGIFNSTSSLVTYDLYRSLNPSSSNRTLLFVGRMTSIVLILCGILLIPVSQALDFGFCLILVRTFVYFASLVAAVFGSSLIMKRVGSLSAQLTLYIVSFMILLRVAAEILAYSHGLQSWIMDIMQAADPVRFIAFVFLTSVFFMVTIQVIETSLGAAPGQRVAHILSENEKK